jgi:transposase-like protein
MKKTYLRLCPECNSTDVHPDMSAESYAKGLFNQWKCDHCGYSGLFFPEYTAEDIKKIKEKK